MRMKSYFAATVEAAMEQAARELGPEALLVNSRKAPPEAQGLGEYEVVFALLAENDAAATGVPSPGTDGNPRRAEPPAEDPVMRELARLRKQLDDVFGAFMRPQGHACTWAARAPEFAAAFSTLVESGFSVDVASRIIRQAHARLEDNAGPWPQLKQRFDAAEVDRAVRSELESAISTDSALPLQDAKASVVALVGPAGSGKTATLVKLAVRYGLACSRPVQLISTDTHRIAALEQLRTYAAIIGAGFDAAETPRVLQQLVETHRQKGLILIDTPGYGSVDMAEATDWARFLSRQSRIDVHLVMPACMREADLSAAIDRFEVFEPAKLIFTRLDELSSFGAIASESIRTGKPVSFLAMGQQIPEDLEPASVPRLVELVLENPRALARSAA